MKNKKVKMIGSIIVLLLLIQPALADLYMEQTIVTDGNVNRQENIFSNGDIISEHNIFSNGDVDLIINGMQWDPHTVGTSIISMESEIEKAKFSSFEGNDVANYINRATSLILGEIPSSNYVSKEIAKALYRTFMPRYEISKMYESLDARLAVWEKWADLYDHDRYCHAKALVSQERGYSNFHCREDQWYHIEPDYIEGIMVEPFPDNE